MCNVFWIAKAQTKTVQRHAINYTHYILLKQHSSSTDKFMSCNKYRRLRLRRLRILRLQMMMIMMMMKMMMVIVMIVMMMKTVVVMIMVMMMVVVVVMMMMMMIFGRQGLSSC